jgi:hypothetical protein
VALLVVLGAAAALGGAGGAVLFSGAPLVALAGLLAGVRRGHGYRAAALAASGLAGLLLSYRRPFHIGDSAYVGPPLLFAFVCAAGLLHWWMVRERTADVRRRLLAVSRLAATLLIVIAFAGRAWHYAEDERTPLPGTEGMISARPEHAGRLLAVERAVEEEGAGGTLAVFPEGEILNYLTGRPNPSRYKLYIPGYLTGENEAGLLADLERDPPDAVVILPRQTSEYGPGAFGLSYGTDIRRWIDENYDRREIERRPGIRHEAAELFVRSARR